MDYERFKEGFQDALKAELAVRGADVELTARRVDAAFERCADVITSLILKYGPASKQKWNLNEWIRNIQAESLWKDIACKRYQRYFICMMNMKSVSA